METFSVRKFYSRELHLLFGILFLEKNWHAAMNPDTFLVERNLATWFRICQFANLTSSQKFLAIQYVELSG